MFDAIVDTHICLFFSVFTKFLPRFLGQLCGLTVFVLFSWVNFRGVSVSAAGPWVQNVWGWGWDSDNKRGKAFTKEMKMKFELTHGLAVCVSCCSDYLVPSGPQTVPALPASVTSQEIPFVSAHLSLSAFHTEWAIKCTSFEGQGARIS